MEYRESKLESLLGTRDIPRENINGMALQIDRRSKLEALDVPLIREGSREWLGAPYRLPHFGAFTKLEKNDVAMWVFSEKLLESTLG